MKQYINPILSVYELNSADVLTSSSLLNVVDGEDEILNYDAIFGINRKA